MLTAVKYCSAVYSCCFICGRHESVTWSAPGHIVHCLSFHLEEQVLISLVGPAATEARWFWDDSKPSCLIPLERLTELWERSSCSHSPPSAVLEEPLQRAGRDPVKVQRLARPAPSLSPQTSSEVVRPTPPWHGASRTAGITAENSPPIHHGSLPTAMCCIGTSLNFGICFRVTQRDHWQLQ